MSKNKLAILLVTVGILTASIFGIYTTMVPKAFYTKEELLDNFSHVTPEMKFNIQAIVSVDEKTFIVPFKSLDDSYGTSIWVWKMGKWENVGTTNSSGPQILTNNGSSYVYWNFHPKDEVQELEIYLTSERNYSVTSTGTSNSMEVYYPGIQVNRTIEVGKESYGYAELPSQWEEITGSLDLNPADAGILPSSHYFMYQWRAFDNKGKEIFLEHTYQSGGGGSYSGDYVRYMQQVNPEDLE